MSQTSCRSLAMADPAQFSDSGPFEFSKICNTKIEILGGDNKTVTATVKDEYLELGSRPDDILLMQAAFDAIVSQHEETRTPSEKCQQCLATRMSY